MKKIEKISFNDFGEMLSLKLGTKILESDFLPDKLDAILNGNGMTVNWLKIPGWHDFENGTIDWGPDEFIEVLSRVNFNPLQRDRIIILSDFFFKEKNVVSIIFSDFRWYTEEIFPEKFNASFEQAQDYLFYCDSISSLAIIHHEGFIASVKSIKAA